MVLCKECRSSLRFSRIHFKNITSIKNIDENVQLLLELGGLAFFIGSSSSAELAAAPSPLPPFSVADALPSIPFFSGDRSSWECERERDRALRDRLRDFEPSPSFFGVAERDFERVRERDDRLRELRRELCEREWDRWCERERLNEIIWQ